jgi:TPR repeat protein
MGTYAPKDLGRAKYWYGQADEKGASEASFMLGRICAQEGDYDGALAAFSRGANRGYLPSIYRQAVMYQDGQGTKKDLNRARALLQEAASKGHVFAKRDLATLYVKGAFGPVLVFRGIALFASLLFDVVGLVIRAIRRGPIVDDRLLG